MPLALLQADAAQRHAVVQRNIRANFGRLANDHAHAVINEKTRANFRSRVDFNARQSTGHL